MSVIKNDSKNNSQKKNVRYEIPAVIREDKGVFPFEKAVVVSLILHICLFGLILLVSLLIKIFGINLDLFKKPEMKPKDIEFVLVEKEAPPINKNTKNRADRDSQAGGKHDPKKPVEQPQTSAPKLPAKKPTPPAPKKQEVVKPKVQPKPAQPAKQPVAKPQVQPQPTVTKTPEVAPKPAAPKPVAPKPTATPTAPKPTVKPTSNFNIPVPKTSIPNIQPSGSPVTSAPKSSGSAGGTGKSGASPSFSPTGSSKGGAGGSGTGTGGGGRFANGTGSGYGNSGNPGPGNPKGSPGIDAVKDADFGPYMRELQRRIKMNWDPPKGDQSKRVVLLFSIARDGRLLNVTVHKSSGSQTADKAAIDAVKLTAPFKPLPPEHKGNSVDIQFTFDYNVFGGSKR